MSNKTIITKLERGRAEFAYRKVKEVLGKNEKIQKEYRSHAKKLPQMILSNGLGQSLAFTFSKAKDKEENAYHLLYSQLSEYLESESVARIAKPQNCELIEWVISLDSTQYRYVTEEVLAFLNWLRRFAEGMIVVDKESSDEGEAGA
jgi:CRISPR-associated protein Cmr5